MKADDANTFSSLSVWCLAAAIGPIVGGSLASQGQWRWLFCECRSLAQTIWDTDNIQDFNLPISFVASLLVVFLMDLPIPPGSYREKFMRMDWMYVRICSSPHEFNLTWRCFTYRGNFLVIASTAAYTIGLTWGGITAPWGSVKVLVPLVLGLVGLAVFITYEATLAKYPLVCIFLRLP